MIRYEANLDGTLVIGEPFTDFSELEILKDIFDELGWKNSLRGDGRGGYYVFDIELRNEKKIRLHIYLKRVTFGGRESRPKEKRVQFSAALERKGFLNYNEETENEFSLILGIYKNKNYSDVIICAWDIHDWGHNFGRAFNCFVDVTTISKALKNGFAQHKTSKGQIVCCFRPQEFKYYLDNRKILHSEIQKDIHSEYFEKMEELITDLKSYSDEIPNYPDLFQVTIDILKNHNGITNINRIELEAGDSLKLTDEARFKIHNHNEGFRTELGYQLAWARFYLKKAGLISSPKRGIWELTNSGWNQIVNKSFIMKAATQREIQNEINQDIQFEDDIEIETNIDNQIIENPFNSNDVDIRTKTMSLDLLIKRLRTDAIDMNTSFQRKANLWDITKQSRLIESILVRFPLPAFYFDGSDDDHWLVVDGLQRLSSLHNYVNLEAFGLENLEFLTQFTGKKFSELPPSLQRRIEEFEITSYIIAAGTPKVLKFNVFKRINTGGLTLTTQEIRNALYQGKATEIVQRLAELRSFKVATAHTISEDRMLDQEFVTRFLAFYIFSYDSYNADLDSFLNNVMDSISSGVINFSAEEIILDFDKAMNAAFAIFQSHAFRKRYEVNGRRKPINKALFEVWSVLLSKLEQDELDFLIINKNLVVEKFINLLNTDDYFNQSITSATGDKSRVKKRFTEIKKIIESTLLEYDY
ncbi:GmrSD restriction endonuclease domain-containing protein [Chryseobacterium binzhouense]|uniref:GmrSD restriction endonuclease domain-containing protein n=1 Tax=Chryseobacterium binzhouense TaxID=2593646 RepID=UPI00117E7BEE|nr:DUF262 domain-containing protein [Chryseobacterium binzhouense]